MGAKMNTGIATKTAGAEVRMKLTKRHLLYFSAFRSARRFDNIGKVMSPRLESPQFDIKHVRHPCQWVPITGVRVGECPYHVLPGETAKNMRIVGHVFVIVIVDEIVVPHRRINRQSAETQRQADQQL